MPLKEVKSDVKRLYLTYQASLLLKCENKEFPCKVYWLTNIHHVEQTGYSGCKLPRDKLAGRLPFLLLLVHVR